MTSRSEENLPGNIARRSETSNYLCGGLLTSVYTYEIGDFKLGLLHSQYQDSQRETLQNEIYQHKWQFPGSDYEGMPEKRQAGLLAISSVYVTEDELRSVIQELLLLLKTSHCGWPLNLISRDFILLEVAVEVLEMKP